MLLSLKFSTSSEETRLFQASRELLPFFAIQLAWCSDANVFIVNLDDSFFLAVMFFDRVFAKLTFVIAMILVVMMMRSWFDGIILDLVWFGSEDLTHFRSLFVGDIALADTMKTNHWTP